MKEVENQCFKLRLKTQTWHFSGFGLCAGSRHNWCFLICERKETDLRSSWPSQLIFLFFAQFFFVLHPGGLIQKGVVSGEQQEALLASITQTNSSRKILLLIFVSPKWLMELGNKDNKAWPEPNQRNSAAYCFFFSFINFHVVFDHYQALACCSMILKPCSENTLPIFLLSLPSIFLQNFQTENLISVPSLPLELNPFEGKLCKCKSKCTKQLCAIEPEWF